MAGNVGCFCFLVFPGAKFSSYFAINSPFSDPIYPPVPVPPYSLKFLRSKVHDVNTRILWFGYFCTPDWLSPSPTIDLLYSHLRHTLTATMAGHLKYSYDTLIEPITITAPRRDYEAPHLFHIQTGFLCEFSSPAVLVVFEMYSNILSGTYPLLGALLAST